MKIVLLKRTILTLLARAATAQAAIKNPRN